MSAGIATAIRPTAAVAVSNDVLTAYENFHLLYKKIIIIFVIVNTIYVNLCTLLLIC